MHGEAIPDWAAIRRQAKRFSPHAFAFLREGLGFTADQIHGPLPEARQVDLDGSSDHTTLAAHLAPDLAQDPHVATRHVTGQQLCHGLRELAVKRYGMLAGTVLKTWRITRTEDFGIIVYSLIDQGELKVSPEDRYEDFVLVYDFDEAFAPTALTIV
ncbi:MAG: hypothetical protein MUE97_03450 [Phycisphaerales bacterium]|jgi:uncharacterized repeat protein (TIGR04138 family)|nr:hypothetical protein [Phycisphaerales bacterium]